MVRKVLVGSVLASLVLALSGCDATTMNAPGNTTLGSAAVGGLGGAAIGAATGHGTKGALIGGAVGAAGGALVGNQMERNRQNAQYQQQGAYNAGYVDGAGGPPPPPPPPRTY
jgi:osmotically inducible lipoprotein OsmB